jgi:hypothetical protein
MKGKLYAPLSHAENMTVSLARQKTAKYVKKYAPIQ